MYLSIQLAAPRKRVRPHAVAFSTLLLSLFIICNISVAQSSSDSTWSFPTVLLDKNQDDTLDYVGETVKIGGIANSSLGQLHTTRLLSAIQNNSYGLPLFTKEMDTPFKAGDSLVVEGHLQKYNGLNELHVESYEVFSDVDRNLSPKSFSEIADQPDRYVGMLVTGSGKIIRKGTLNNGKYVAISTDYSSEFSPLVFVSNFHESFKEFDFDVLSVGDEITVTGILSEHMPRSSNDHNYMVYLRTPDELTYASLPRYYFYVAAIIIVLVLIGVGIWIISLRQKVETKTHQIQKSLDEKDVLLREIHHRVKNNLSIISGLLGLQQDSTEVKSTQDALKDSQSRIRSMALIHDKLYQTESLSDIRLDEYLKELVEAICKTFVYYNDTVELEFDLDPTKIDIDNVVPCGLLVNELVVNSFKHAFSQNRKGTLIVKLKNISEGAELTIADDGPGLPDDFELDNGDSLGSMLINTFAAQLEADMSINRDHQGAAFTFRFPLN